LPGWVRAVIPLDELVNDRSFNSVLVLQAYELYRG
jgi:hypothetical protein